MGENSRSIDPIGFADGFSPTRPYDPPERDRELAGRLRRLFELSRQDRARFDSNWSLYLAYIVGDQLLYRDTSTGELVRVLDADKQRLWSINNQLGPIVRSRVGKFTRGTPTFRVAPGVGGQDQVQGARVADRFIEYFRDKEDIDGLYRECVEDEPWAAISFIELYLDVMGGAKIHACLNPQCGREAMHAEEGAPCAVCGGPTECRQELDIKAQHLDPRMVFLQPGAIKLSDVDWYITRYPMSVQRARAMHPDFAEHLHAESDVYLDDGIRHAYSAETGVWNSTTLEDHLVLYRYTERPTALYPKGRVITWANDIILEEIESPYHVLNRLPLFAFMGARTPGRLYPVPFISNAYHRQKELNELETHKREYAEIVSHPKTLVPIGSRIATDEISATSVQVINYNRSAGAPEVMKFPEFPVSLDNRRVELVEDMRIQANVTMQEMGQAPTDPNGRVMAMQEAESDQTIGPIVRQHNKELSELYRAALVLAQRYFSPDRKFALMGEDAFEVYSFQDLNIVPGWSIAIEAEDGLSKNQAIRFNEVMTLAQAGVFGQPGMMDVGKLAKAARLKIPGLVPNSSDSEFSAAMAAIKMIEDGQAYVPQMEDDPVIFANVILAWLQGTGRRIRSKQPLVYQGVQQLLKQYMMMMFQAQQAQQQLMAPPGDPSVAGGGTSAPGGSPNGAMPADGNGSPIVEDTQSIVSGADAAGESAARGGQPQES